MKKRIFTKGIAIALCAVLGVMSVAGCSGQDTEEETTTQAQKEKETAKKEMKALSITLDENTTYQTIESFGASGAWWSQDVGGWTEENNQGVEKREQIAALLFDKEEGIGLTAYRYNIGAGTADSGESFAGITDRWRRAESFETEAGVYDWTKDENAVWFMDRAVELGAEELVFFCNSPLERLTKNGKGYGDAAEEGGTTSNLSEENYRAFAEYVMDVVEHFKEEGYPVKYVSPINEPQWEWTGGQEGCHYEPEELVSFLNVFLDVMEERNVEGVELSAPELGEWGNTSNKYYEAIFADERLRNTLTSFDVHSYWSDLTAKNGFLQWLERSDIDRNGLELKMSEWCEMTNGRDLTMDSAVNLAKEMYFDLTTLNVTSWQYWIAVSCYDYRDGLIYVNLDSKSVYDTRRLWAMGNYSRFIRPGYVRIECTSDNSKILSSAYKGTDEEGNENLVVVIINTTGEDYELSAGSFGDWTTGDVYVTDDDHILGKTQSIEEGTVTVPDMSVVTITLSR